MLLSSIEFSFHFDFLWYSSFVINFPRFCKQYSGQWKILLLRYSQNNYQISVFLTHVSIQQMLTWLLTSKKKITTSCWYFFADMILCATWKGKFETIKIKLEQNPNTQKNMCLLHISKNFKNIFKYKLYSLSLANCKQLRMCNHLYRPQLSDRFFK